MKNEFVSHGKKINLNEIKVPILVLAATYDHIVPIESQKAILDLISSEDKEMYEMKKGHIGITTSRSSHKEFWPRVIRWLEERSKKV
jgi:Poly(3-hydroxyalkanoate) synthetase